MLDLLGVLDLGGRDDVAGSGGEAVADGALSAVGIRVVAVSQSRGAEDAVRAFAVGRDESGKSKSDDGGKTHFGGVGWWLVVWLLRRKFGALDWKLTATGQKE